MYLAVETQIRFLAGCQESDLNDVKGQDLEMARREAKERNQALKRQISREVEEYAKLCQEYSDIYQDAMRWHEECQSELRELSHLMEEKASSEEPDPLPENIFTEWESALQTAADDTRLGTEKAARMVVDQSHDILKRRKLGYERHCLFEEQRKHEQLRDKLGHLEAQQLAEIEKLESLACFESELGLPRIEFNDSKGIVVLGEPASIEGDDREIRTIKVEHDAFGRLVRAEPHPSLGLWNEGTISVENNDLARLLTLVWDRVCEQHDGLRIEQGAELGGA